MAGELALVEGGVGRRQRLGDHLAAIDAAARAFGALTFEEVGLDLWQGQKGGEVFVFGHGST